MMLVEVESLKKVRMAQNCTNKEVQKIGFIAALKHLTIKKGPVAEAAALLP